MRKEKNTDNEPEPTALACSDFPTREEIDELNRIGIDGVLAKREKEFGRHRFIEEVKFWWPIVVGSIVGGVTGTVLYRWLRG